MDLSLFNSTPMDPLNVTDSSHCTRCLLGLACLTSVHSDCLPSCSLWRQCCSLAVALSSCSRRNFSLAFSIFIGIQLHGEESSITFSKSCVQIRNVRVPSFPFVQLNGHTHANRQIDRQTYTCILQCSPASVELAQAHPNQYSAHRNRMLSSSATVKLQRSGKCTISTLL